MRPGASPLWEQVLFAIVGPPMMALLIRAGSRKWAHAVQGAALSQQTERRQQVEFWSVLIIMYLMVIGIVIYAAM